MTFDINTIKERIKGVKPSVIIAALVSAFFFASAVNVKLIRAKFTEIGFLQGVKLPLFAFLIVLITAGLLAAAHYFKKKRLIPSALAVSAVVYFTLMAMEYSDNVWFYAGSMIVLLIVFLFYVKNTVEFDNDRIFTYRSNLILAAFLFVVFTAFTSLSTICRYKAYGASCFDFGIFSQMFEYMRTTGLPNTTVERNGLVSHFSVHFSPIFYLILPGYMIFKTPCYLLVIQALCIGAGVFAVPGICRELEIKPKYSFVFTIIYILYPTLSFGQNYDFHENKFLTVCIMWMLYFMFRKKYVPMYVFALLTCMVKEDAAIYLVAIALFMMFELRDIKHGSVMLIGALVYFVFALKMVTVFGGGDSDFGYRYSDFDPGTQIVTIGDIIKGLVLDFGYGLKVMFADKKFEFLLWMMLPVAFMPFLTRKISTLLLITPMIFVNFLSSWHFQYSIKYQYTFGVAALIIVSSVYVWKRLSSDTARTAACVALSMCIIMTVPMFSTQLKNNYRQYKRNEAVYSQRDAILKTIPRDASVIADSCLVAHIADIKVLYPNSYDGEKTDYILIDTLTGGFLDRYEKYRNEYTGIVVAGKCIVLKRNDLATEAERTPEQTELFLAALNSEEVR